MSHAPEHETFITESRELLDNMETALLAVDSSSLDAEAVNAIFRAAHTIKGGAGLFSFQDIVTFTHAVENVLDAVRNAELNLDAELVDLLLACVDYVRVLVNAVDDGEPDPDPATSRSGAQLLERLHASHTPAPVQVQRAPLEMELWDDPPESAESVPDNSASLRGDIWHVSLRFGRDVLRNGMDPLSFIRYLGTIGTIAGIATLPDAIPPTREMDPTACYLGFEIALRSQADKQTIERVFELVRDDCSVRILPPNSRISEYIRLIEEQPEGASRLGELLVGCGSVTSHELDAALAIQNAAPPPAPKLGSILVAEGIVGPSVVEAALAKQERTREAGRQEARSIRVDADKLDHLINLIGELTIAAAGTSLMARRAHCADVQESAATLAGLVQDVRDSTLKLRMVKIGAAFHRFQRVARDVARDIGKDVTIELSGEDTELDKTVIEGLTDPLTHLVRNAIDHGIESHELRTARGKPAQGTVRLDAYHDSGHVVIDVCDDGGGLKREKILARAIERGLIEAGASPDDEELFEVIFEPGFSTADQVTKLSGRGVGMDVVKRNIAALRGSVSISSEEGVGTTVSVRTPLTLAIINGFLVGLDASLFVVPLDAVEECVELQGDYAHNFIDLRGHVLPYIRLRERLGITGRAGRRESIVVVNHNGRRAGLVVDSLLGEFQTVIKPLSKMFNGLKCVSGSTILGDGRVGLILDVPALVAHAERRSAAAASAGDRPTEGAEA